MWANAQRDGRPAEYGRHPLFNAAKFAATSHTASELDSVMEFGLKPTKATGTAYTSVYLRTRCMCILYEHGLWTLQLFPSFTLPFSGKNIVGPWYCAICIL